MYWSSPPVTLLLGSRDLCVVKAVTVYNSARNCPINSLNDWNTNQPVKLEACAVYHVVLNIFHQF